MIYICESSGYLTYINNMIMTIFCAHIFIFFPPEPFSYFLGGGGLVNAGKCKIRPPPLSVSMSFLNTERAFVLYFLKIWLFFFCVRRFRTTLATRWASSWRPTRVRPSAAAQTLSSTLSGRRPALTGCRRRCASLPWTTRACPPTSTTASSDTTWTMSCSGPTCLSTSPRPTCPTSIDHRCGQACVVI